MQTQYVPVLAIQQDLYRRPRDFSRFRQYLRTIITATGDDLDLPPLVFMNPMGREHLNELLNAYLAIAADELAAKLVEETRPQFGEHSGSFSASLVLIDDLKGGWTNRYACEHVLRFETEPGTKRFWITAALWSSEPASEQAVRDAMLTALFRTAYQIRHGMPQTVAEKMAQEGNVLAVAGCEEPTLELDDLEYTRELIAPLRDARDMRTAVEVLFGDAAGATLGFTPRGLSPNAGLALAWSVF